MFRLGTVDPVVVDVAVDDDDVFPVNNPAEVDVDDAVDVVVVDGDSLELLSLLPLLLSLPLLLQVAINPFKLPPVV